MASLPSPTQVAGSHQHIYEAYYYQIDPNNVGRIEALDAARFLKKSKLSDIVLGKIWDLSDPTGKGYLNKQGFFVALKLCALAQAGRGISMENVVADAPHPKMGDIPKLPASKVINSTQPGMDWAVKPTEKAKYDQLFDSLQPTNGFIPGNKVRGVLMESKLPIDMLGKIWDLADLDKDGSLSRHEFMIAMHLVYKALEKHSIPNTLPPELLPPGRTQPPLIMGSPKPPLPPQPSIPPLPSVPLQPSRPPLPTQPQAPPLISTAVIMQQPTSAAAPLVAVAPLVPVAPLVAPQAPPVQWVVSGEDKAKADALFQQTDADHDGFVSGLEIKNVFLQSGVLQSDLAHIWSLCDTKQTGKLNNEQFALAMWLIQQKMMGLALPAALTPDMVPPSMRPRADGQTEPAVATVTPYSNPELDLIAADIRELTRERNTLETDIAQKEADIKIKNGEVKSLQSELDTLAATLKQLENQKGEAQKRLNDLKTQKSAVEVELTEVVQLVEAEQALVDKLRNQAEEQEESLKSQENELSSKKQELEGLKQEEARLEGLQEESRRMLDGLATKLQNSQLQISQVKAKVSQLEELQRQMSDAIALCESATTSGDASVVPDTSLSIGPDFREADISKLTMPSPQDNKDNTFSNMNGTSAFDDTPFPNDAFSNHSAFGDSDPFGSSFEPPAKPAVDGADPFNAFGGPPTSIDGKADPFDPFNDTSSRQGAKSPMDVADKDPFGCDPFANLHAPERHTNPPPRPESPSPALPPKKSKQPPPRPAPPRPMQPSMRAAPVPPTPSPDVPPHVSETNDAFSGSTGGFANFANFDSKCDKTVTGSGGLRPGSASSASSSPSPATQPRYASFEFTEDPFKNYRYDDLFNIADPFDDANQPAPPPPKWPGKSDPFGFQTDDLAYETPVGGEFPTVVETFEAKFPNIDAFDVSFPKDPFDKVNGNDSFYSNSDRNANPKAKEDKLPTEDVQLMWAAQESLRAEQERQKRAEQEKADLEYALTLSKKDSSRDKKKSSLSRNLLRLGRNS